jgi:hypothetical protein
MPAAHVGTETVANVIVNPSAATGQLVTRNNFTVTTLATLNLGVLGVASGHTGNFQAIQMTGGTLRVAGSAGASTMNVGSGGITASGGVIEVKFNTNNQDAFLNLAGNFTATGNVAINNGAYTGGNTNLITLTSSSPIFDIATSTTTTVAPDINSVTGLTKSGGGNLVLNASCLASISGTTTVSAGQLTILGILNGSDVVSSGTLAGNGSILTGIVGVDLNLGGKISPGTTATPSALIMGLNTGKLDLVDAVTPTATGALIFDLNSPSTSDSIATSSGAVHIGTGVLEIDDFVFTPGANFEEGIFTLISSDQAINGTLGTSLTTTLNGIPAKLALADGNTDLVLIVTLNTPLQSWRQTYFGSTQNTGDGANTSDPDKDGLPNLIEFLLGTLPNDAASTSPITTQLASGELSLTYTRVISTLSDVTPTVEWSDDLIEWSTVGVNASVVTNTATTETIKAVIPQSGNTLFLRLRATEAALMAAE